ncbi:trigger factor [Venenivibrio stagnispumantis]|uniref:Trigger factor n=1 Tax=Venenivibrio stagnispumantis TaxID=407998 RepID=A0AA46ADJ2_9AQUI|nr:trigger factor [Venenivibrio stagnispumantis]MCW4572960.1 trigger factor [Venenivibrio stagnispumantis]SMP05189.1 trigger factor [Venenivibrio stagnispumantis]
MNVVVESKDLVRTLTIEDQGEKVKEIVEEIIRELTKNAEIKGFRKGQAPKSIVKARYKDLIKEETAKQYIGKYLNEILEKENLKPVTQEISFGEIELENDEKLKFKVEFEVAPEFELKDYENIEVETLKVEVTEEDIQKEIDSILEENITYEVADKAIEIGDEVEIEYHIVAEDGSEEKDIFEAVIGAGMLRKEIEDALIGKKAGDEVKLENVPLYNPEGKEIGKATVNIKILEVRQEVKPEFNDEFVKSIELGENVEEARQKIKEIIENALQIARKRNIEDQILGKLAQDYDFPVPVSLLEIEANALLNRYESQLKNYGIKPNRDMIEAVKPNMIASAERNVKIMFILNKIAEKEGLSVSEEELNAKIEELAKLYDVSTSDMKAYLQEKGMIEGIKSDILRQKALDKVIEKANIKELSKEEYEAKLKEKENQAEEVSNG